jgi:malate synthase
MTDYVERHGMRVARVLCDLIESEIAPGTQVSPDQFWRHYAAMLSDLAPRNRQLLETRDRLQRKIDDWHLARKGQDWDGDAYRAFLTEIGYLVPAPSDFAIDTENVDPEIASMAGPQLVVPVSNARFAINAANARWGSLYDALYGTDAVDRSGALVPGNSYNPFRGAQVVARAAAFLDLAIPLTEGQHAGAKSYTVARSELQVVLADGRTVALADPTQFRGQAEGRLLFAHNGLHVEIVFDPYSAIGRISPAHISDIIIEAAVTTIQDCEDSVSAVDADDKVMIYRNWLGLMKGDLSEQFEKGGRTISRSMAPDRSYQAPDGLSFTLPGRSLLLVRNVGHLMTTDAVLDSHGNETPEGMLDGMVTAFAALHDLGKTGGARNSRKGSVYIVKPKMHGPDEVAFTNTLFDRIEDALALPRHTLKVGVMDEERRTSVNLAACIAAVRHRLVFINTGFLDRTGDEIHTSMQAGPVLPKGEIKDAVWLGAYENNNVDQGLKAGMSGKAQIGKGMWARPDDMAEMLSSKIGHPRAGANTAWVPSPTAAVLHATHYHQVDVASVQNDLQSRALAALDSILTPPLLGGRNLSSEEVQRELDNNAQSMLGYVVRWVDQGVGCSKVPDIDNVALMEDRATLRISSQHIANWLLHGLLTREQVDQTFKRMALVVDRQNERDPAYQSMMPNFGQSVAFQTALELALQGTNSPNGYTEPVLHRRRRQFKSLHSQFGSAQAH